MQRPEETPSGWTRRRALTLAAATAALAAARRLAAAAAEPVPPPAAVGPGATPARPSDATGGDEFEAMLRAVREAELPVSVEPAIVLLAPRSRIELPSTARRRGRRR